ncbi:hypothetical protein D9M71_559000 [compost metagenome]
MPGTTTTATATSLRAVRCPSVWTYCPNWIWLTSRNTAFASVPTVGTTTPMTMSAATMRRPTSSTTECRTRATSAVTPIVTTTGRRPKSSMPLSSPVRTSAKSRCSMPSSAATPSTGAKASWPLPMATAMASPAWTSPRHWPCPALKPRSCSSRATSCPPA